MTEVLVLVVGVDGGVCNDNVQLQLLLLIVCLSARGSYIGTHRRELHPNCVAMVVVIACNHFCHRHRSWSVARLLPLE